MSEGLKIYLIGWVNTILIGVLKVGHLPSTVGSRVMDLVLPQVATFQTKNSGMLTSGLYFQDIMHALGQSQENLVTNRKRTEICNQTFCTRIFF